MLEKIRYRLVFNRQKKLNKGQRNNLRDFIFKHII